MLFSNPEIAAFIRENFVAAWESVRPVPVVTIDFGNGQTLKRTVNGNTATYICAPDGRVIDVIPGLMEPKAYLGQLRSALNLWRRAEKDFDRVVLEHHQSPPPYAKEIVVDRYPDVGKRSIELPVRRMSEEDRLLAEDTKLNLSERKPLIHAMLAERIVKPSEITKRLYRDVLHCDLDDPYLGLGTKVFDGGGYGDKNHR